MSKNIDYDEDFDNEFNENFDEVDKDDSFTDDDEWTSSTARPSCSPAITWPTSSRSARG